MNDYIPRLIQPGIEQRLSSNKVIVLTGTRRVGKTFLIRKIKDNYSGKALLLNGEDMKAQELLSYRSIEHYQQWLGDTQLLIVDEAQTIPEAGKALKLLIDEIPGLTILATGSSSFDLTNKTGEPLTGRKIHFDLYPFSQAELNQVENRVETFARLDDRLVFGTYPEVVALPDAAAKSEYLRGLVNSYLLKDILAFEQVKSSAKLLQLLQLLSFQVGNEVSYDELGRQLSLHRNTVERYLDLLSKVFIIFRMGGFSSNLRKEIVKSSKWYFFDNGVRNAVIGDFTLFPARRDVGQLWENYLLAERIKRNSYLRLHTEYFFWRTYDQQEIDLVERQNGELQTYEFKWKDRAGRQPVFFEKNYPGVRFTIVHRDNYFDFIM